MTIDTTQPKCIVVLIEELERLRDVYSGISDLLDRHDVPSCRSQLLICKVEIYSRISSITKQLFDFTGENY